MSVVITYGTFDLFHVGHVRLFERLKAMGTRLVVGVSTDEFNASKGKRTIIPYDHRVELVRSTRYVDEAFAESAWDQKRLDVVNYRADIFAMGDDWAGKFDDLADLCQVVYLPRTTGISSTKIKTSIRPLSAVHIGELRSAIETIGEVIVLMELGE